MHLIIVIYALLLPLTLVFWHVVCVQNRDNLLENFSKGAIFKTAIADQAGSIIRRVAQPGLAPLAFGHPNLFASFFCSWHLHVLVETWFGSVFYLLGCFLYASNLRNHWKDSLSSILSDHPTINSTTFVIPLSVSAPQLVRSAASGSCHYLHLARQSCGTSCSAATWHVLVVLCPVPLPVDEEIPLSRLLTHSNSLYCYKGLFFFKDEQSLSRATVYLRMHST